MTVSMFMLGLFIKHHPQGCDRSKHAGNGSNEGAPPTHEVSGYPTLGDQALPLPSP